MDRTERFYKIDQMLQAGLSVSFARLQEALGISRAQVKRDLAYMRERLNAPIEYGRDSNGYRFGRPFAGRATGCPGCGSRPPRSTRSSPCSTCSRTCSPDCSPRT